MKKLIYTIVLFCFIFLGSCQSTALPGMEGNLKSISTCCKGLAVARCKAPVFFGVQEKTEPETKSTASYLPAYTWDAKQMFW